MSSYNDLAENIIKDFIRAVVLIDDHWSEAQNAPATIATDLNKIIVEPPSIPPESAINLDDEIVLEEEASSIPVSDQTDPAYLREIGSEITKQGFLFTGLAYTDANKDTAFNLASKSDVLILDWCLGAGDTRPALNLLERLKSSGSPRFVFILTDQSLQAVRDAIAQRLGTIEEEGLIFNCGSFSFSLMNKPQAGGENTVKPKEVLGKAVEGIRNRFGGLLQLAALQILSRYNVKLHAALAHFRSELDVPFIAEWHEEKSPIGPNTCFSGLMIDEWKSLVDQDEVSTKSILSDEGVTAFIAAKKNIPNWGGTSAKGVQSKITTKQKKNFPLNGDALRELEREIQNWMSANGCKMPLLTKPNGITWTPDSAKAIINGYLSIALSNKHEYREQLVSLDAFFHTLPILPSHLTQGTVLQRKAGGEHLVCITPTCDCERPERIENRYSFLLADQIQSDGLVHAEENAVVAVRTQDGYAYLLKVLMKPPLSFTIKNGSLNNNDSLTLMNPFSSKQSFSAKPIAQLRPSRVQSLVSLTAGKATEIGLNRSELLRQRCKANA